MFEIIVFFGFVLPKDGRSLPSPCKSPECREILKNARRRPEKFLQK
jgi:hypothetical protein